jgi:hypothetical protein
VGFYEKPWSSQEDVAIVQLYPKQGAKCRKNWPTPRSAEDIDQRASDLGVKFNNSYKNSWDEDEDATLFALYPSRGAIGVKQVLGHRTLEAIRNRAAILSVKIAERYSHPGEHKQPEQGHVQHGTLGLRSIKGGGTGSLFKEPIRPKLESAAKFTDLPWLKYPKTAAGCRGVIDAIDWAFDFSVVSEETKSFLTSVQVYMEALAKRFA